MNIFKIVNIIFWGKNWNERKKFNHLVDERMCLVMDCNIIAKRMRCGPCFTWITRHNHGTKKCPSSMVTNAPPYEPTIITFLLMGPLSHPSSLLAQWPVKNRHWKFLQIFTWNIFQKIVFNFIDIFKF